MLRAAFAIAACLIACRASTGQQPSLDDPAKDAATAFVKAVNAKDLKTLLHLCDVPWFEAGDDEDRIIAKRADLDKTWEKNIAKVNTGPMATIRVKKIWT